MKPIWALLVMGLVIFYNPSAYAGEGHDAGREWAEENGIDDPDYDEGNSESFNEGVRQYVEDNAEDDEGEGE